MGFTPRIPAVLAAALGLLLAPRAADAAFIGQPYHIPRETAAVGAMVKPREPAVITMAAADLHPLLMRRQVSSTSSRSITYTVTIAPDSTCGWLSASAGSPVTCTNGGRCMWETQYLDVIICGITEFEIKGTCFERDVALDPLKCNDVCESNVFNLLCTATSAPFCRTYAYPNGVIDYRCASTTVTAVQSVSHTYRSQTDRTFSTLVLSDDPTTTSSTKPPTTTSPGPTTSTSTTFTTLPPTPDAGGGSSSSSNVGPIVGGVIGGVAVISFLVIGILFLLRRSRNSNAAHLPTQPAVAAAAMPPPSTPGAPPSMSYAPSNYTAQYPPGSGAGIYASGMAPGGMMDPNMGGSPTSQYTFDPNTGAKLGPDGVMYVGGGQLRPTSPEQSQYDALSVMSGSTTRGVGGGTPNIDNRVSTMSGAPPPPVGAGQFQGYTIPGQQGMLQEIGDSNDQHRGQIHEAGP